MAAEKYERRWRSDVKWCLTWGKCHGAGPTSSFWLRIVAQVWRDGCLKNCFQRFGVFLLLAGNIATCIGSAGGLCFHFEVPKV